MAMQLQPALRPIRRDPPNTGGLDISPIILFLLILLVERNHHALHLPLRVLNAACERAVQDRRRPVLRGLPPRRDAPPRDAAHAHRRRRVALFGAHRDALRRAERRDLRPRDRLSAVAGRRPACLPRRVRQDGRRRLAQRGRQSRLRRLPISQAGLSRRHAVGDFRGDRTQGEPNREERRRQLCARRASISTGGWRSTTCAG